MRASTFFVLLAHAGVLPVIHAAPPIPSDLDPSVSETHLIAPWGKRIDPTKTFELPGDSHIRHVGDRIHVHHPNGTLLHDIPHTPKNATVAATAEKRLKTGWVAYEYFTATTPISEFKTYWTVPAAPSAWNGQLLYFFNGLQPLTGTSAILQPVLQYGVSPAGGGAYWSIASWYVTDSNTFHTTPVRVNVGQAINGYIHVTGRSASGTTYSYNSQFSNIGVSTSLNIHEIGELSWAAEAFEAYSLASKSNYPPAAHS
ncbi:hypothetical protein B0H14DRAFT_2595838 [Mycena olivaceomarginata]|nr:hypothetical protein B0H14DRAFT_2595838 [Mycena olivaceomarginata]